VGYMGFGMRKEVYDRKAKEAFAYRKRHDKSEKVRKYVRLMFSLMAVAIILVTIYAVLLEV